MEFQTLREQLRGDLITPEDPDYDQARVVYNAMIDRRPLAVARAADVADVIAVVRAAADADLPLAVRGGAHSVPGFGTVDDGIVLDLGAMRGVRVDPVARTARVGGGATWGDVDHATHAFGLATTGGIISTTGVGGLTLGGGIGYLARAHGLSCDNLRSADVVTADGELVQASADSHPDLFWALRGGGGNFGVVTSFEFDLHPVDVIYGGPAFYELEDAEAVLRWYRDWIGEQPRTVGAFFAWQIAPPLPFIPEDRHGDTLCVMVFCVNGPADRAAALLDARHEPATPLAEHIGPMPYPALNSAFDALVPPGLQHYWKADFVTELTDAAIAAHLEHGPRVPCVQSTMHLYSIDGAVADVAPGDTAFAYRGANFAPVIAGMWPDPADNEHNIDWVRRYWEATHPHSEPGGYINFMAGDDQGRIRDNYGPNYDRLVAVKRRYDPDNRFRVNQNIDPSG